MYVYRRLSRIRRFVFWAAIVLYIATFPVIILDVTGIQLRPAQRKPWVQTGALEVITRPEGCQVVVNGQAARTLTPAVVEGLTPGRHDVILRPSAGPSWHGSIDIEAGLVTSLKGLPVGSPAAARIRLHVGPVLSVHRSLASASALLVTRDDPHLALLDLAAGRITPIHGLNAGGPVAAVFPLMSDAEFLVEIDRGGRRIALLLDQSALGGWSLAELPFGIPQGSIPLACSWRERSVMFLDGRSIVQRSAAGDRTLFVTGSPIIALGETPAGVLALDGEGRLYHQGRFLAPRAVAAYDLGTLAARPAGTPGRIVAQRGAVLVVQSGSSLYLLTRSRSVEVPGVTGAALDDLHERIVVWSDDRVGRLDHPWIEAEAQQDPDLEPSLRWILRTESPVADVVPMRESDAVLIATSRAVLVGALSERALLAPVEISSLERGAVPPIFDPTGIVVLAAGVGELDLLRLAPPPQTTQPTVEVR